MKIPHRFSALTLPLLTLRRPFLLLLALALLTALLSGGFALAGRTQLEQSGLGAVTLGIVSGRQGDTVDTLITQFTQQADVFPNVRLLAVPSEEEARQQVREGTLSAALLLPDDLLNWVNGRGGENPLLIVNNLSGVEYAIFNTVGNSYLRALTVAQRGVSLACQAYDLAAPTHISYNVVWMGANLAYLNLVIDQMTRFEDQIVSGPQSLSFVTHSILCICFCFCLLLTPLLHHALSLQKNAAWIQRLGSIGRTPWQNARGQMLVCAAGFALLLLLLAAGLVCVQFGLGETIALSPLLLPALLLGALFLAGFSFFFANLGSPVLGGILSSLISIFALITAGGLVPKVLLPKVLQRLSGISPILWLRDLFAAALCGANASWWLAALALLLCSVGLFLGSYLLCKRDGRVFE